MVAWVPNVRWTPTSRRVIAAALAVGAWATAAGAGVLDWLPFKGSKAPLPSAVAEARATEYLHQFLKATDLKIQRPRSDLTAKEKQTLDRHVVSRMDRFDEWAVADVKGPSGSGLVVVAGRGLAKGAWSPTKDYVGYLSLVVPHPLPREADRALSLMAHAVGKAPLFGVSPEAGPIWIELESYLQGPGGAGGPPAPPGAGRLSGGSVSARGTLDFIVVGADDDDDSEETPILDYSPDPRERPPSADDVPAWVVRARVPLKSRQAKVGEKPLDLGLLMAMERQGNRGCRITHVTSTGGLSAGLFAGAIKSSILEGDGDEDTD